METPTPTTCLKSTAVHLQFVRQYAPHLYRWLLSFEERETLQYASHLYCSTPPICTAVRPPFVRQYAPHLYGSTLEKYWGWGHRNVSDKNDGQHLSPVILLGATGTVSFGETREALGRPFKVPKCPFSPPFLFLAYWEEDLSNPTLRIFSGYFLPQKNIF